MHLVHSHAQEMLRIMVAAMAFAGSLKSWKLSADEQPSGMISTTFKSSPND